MGRSTEAESRAGVAGMGGGDGKCVRVDMPFGRRWKDGNTLNRLGWWLPILPNHLGHLDELCGIWIMFQ